MNQPHDNLLPPQNLDAERSVIGSCLRYGSFAEVQGILVAEDFYDFANRVVFEAMIDLDKRSVSIDRITVQEWIDSSVYRDDVRRDYLRDVTEVWISPGVVSKAEIVRSKATMRALQRACRETMAEIDNQSMPEEEILTAAEKSIFQLSQRRFSKGRTRLVKDVVNDAVDRIDERTIATREGKHASTGVPSSFIDLDFFMGGFHPSELTIIAARPSVGKTAFGVNIFYAAMVYSGLPCLFFSLEQPDLELAERLVCMDSLVDSHLIRTGKLANEDAAKIEDSRIKMQPLLSWINDHAGMTMSMIASEARKAKSKHDLRMVIVDYLQLVEPENRYDSRHLQVGDTSRRLKLLAKELKVPVVAMAQLGRNADQRQKPRLSDLRESGNIEQDADNVLILHNPNHDDPNNAEIELIIAKQRNGPTGDVGLVFHRKYMRFYNLATP